MATGVVMNDLNLDFRWWAGFDIDAGVIPRPRLDSTRGVTA